MFEQITSLYKINDVILPTRNECWLPDENNKVGLSIYNTLLDLDNPNLIIMGDSFMGDKHSGFIVCTPIRICKLQNEYRPLAICKSKNTGSMYLIDMRYCIKLLHKFEKIGNKYFIEDYSWCSNGGYPYDLYNSKDKNTIFEIISKPYTKVIEIEGRMYFKQFINVHSPKTNKNYSVLYYKENEIS